MDWKDSALENTPHNM